MAKLPDHLQSIRDEADRFGEQFILFNHDGTLSIAIDNSEIKNDNSLDVQMALAWGELLMSDANVKEALRVFTLSRKTRHNMQRKAQRNMRKAIK